MIDFFLCFSDEDIETVLQHSVPDDGLHPRHDPGHERLHLGGCEQVDGEPELPVAEDLVCPGVPGHLVQLPVNPHPAPAELAADRTRLHFDTEMLSGQRMK